MGWNYICFIVACMLSVYNGAIYSQDRTQKQPYRIAFISDAHIQDVVVHPKLIRSMEVQVQSTRLFNENYFALIAALDDVAERNISIVILPGDLTDDGQLVNQEAVKRVLNEYATLYGMSFFVTTGNHDPQRPFGMEYFGKDFLTSSGQTTTLASSASFEGKGGLACAEVDTTLRSVGYQEEMACYANFGYFPRSAYLYWETPFSSYTYDTYNYRQAVDESKIERRCYILCDSVKATDASYLVEPVEGLWLLAIDGGVYLPAGIKDGKQEYLGAGAGYNNVLRHKGFLLPWVRKVVAEARKRNKTLVTFCHYPLTDFNDGASALVASAWGKDKFDLYRVPDDSITEAFLDAGIRLHVAGHMHVNDTGVKLGKNGKHLYNIQIPSIATYMPAYKILTAEGPQNFKVETVVLDSVPGFNSFFRLYEREYAHTMATGRKPMWSKEALSSKNYMEFCDWQFRDLVRVRFVPGDLPAILKDSLLQMNGAQLLEYVSSGKSIRPDSSFARWTGADLVLDLYRLRYAGRLAERNISEKRINQYQVIFEEIRRRPASSEFRVQLRELANIFDCFLHSEPCVNFSIDLEKDKIKVNDALP